MSDEKIGKEIEYLQNLASYNGPDRVVTSWEMRDLIETAPDNDLVIKDTGFPTVDKYTEGHEGGELVVVAGPTGHGKTLYCQSMTDTLTTFNRTCLWFSYEVTPKHFLKRFHPRDPLFMLPLVMASTTLKWVEDRIVESILKYKTNVVFIDHLHFLIEIEKLNNPSFQLGAIVIKLKQLALNYNIVIFLICHLTKTDPMKEPTENDIRDSSFIAQYADTVLMIYRPPENDPLAENNILKVRKCRRTGARGKGKLLKWANGRLMETDEYVGK